MVVRVVQQRLHLPSSGLCSHFNHHLPDRQQSTGQPLRRDCVASRDLLTNRLQLHARAENRQAAGRLLGALRSLVIDHLSHRPDRHSCQRIAL